MACFDFDFDFFFLLLLLLSSVLLSLFLPFFPFIESLPIEHLERLVGQSFDVVEVLNGGVLFALRLAGVDVKQVAEMADAVMSILVQSTKQFLQALLDTVGVGRILIKGIRVASHSVALLLVNGGQNALLMNGRQLSFLHDILVFHRFDQFLESAKADWIVN